MNINSLELIEKIAKEVCEKNHVGLYDLNFKNIKKGRVLTVEIMKIDGVTIQDCENVSKDLGEILDEKDIIQGKYYLEVSSPGLERNLTQKKHYISAINEKIKVTYKENEKTDTLTGILTEVLPESIKIRVNNAEKEISFKDIKKAKTIFEK